jgi:signal transduction histidine kinase
VTLTTSSSLADFKSMAGSTIEECDHLLGMINTMLLISKTEAGVERADCKEMDIANVVKDAADLFLPLAEESGVKMRLDIPEMCTFHGDVRMMQRMISNLLDNAIKFTPAGGTVDISLHSENDTSVVLAVKDTGIGISEADLAHVFDRFYRGDPSRPQVGSGLGLSLVKAIANAHGGSINAVSTLGEGSTFSVTLPKSPPPLPLESCQSDRRSIG